MAQQRLDGPEIAAAGKEVRRESVAQRVRGGALAQSQLGPQPRLTSGEQDRPTMELPLLALSGPKLRH
jgi:hypothetical protein